MTTQERPNLLEHELQVTKRRRIVTEIEEDKKQPWARSLPLSECIAKQERESMMDLDETFLIQPFVLKVLQDSIARISQIWNREAIIKYFDEKCIKHPLYPGDTAEPSARLFWDHFTNCLSFDVIDLLEDKALKALYHSEELKEYSEEQIFAGSCEVVLTAIHAFCQQLKTEDLKEYLVTKFEKIISEKFALSDGRIP